MTNNEYFDWRSAQASCRFSYALRTQQEISQFARGNNLDLTARYDHLRDAMKLTVPDNVVTDGSHVGIQSSLSPQIWCPIRLTEMGQTIVIWDWYADPSWSYENGFRNIKAWMIRRNTDIIWLEPDHDHMEGRTRHSRVRPYTELGPPPQTIAGPFKVYSDNGDRVEPGTNKRYSQYVTGTLGPVLANVYCTTGEWIRKMLVLHQQPTGFVEVSYYITSESVPITQVLDRVLVSMPLLDRPDVFAFHFNDSNLRARDGTPDELAAIVPAISWGRNVTVHRGVLDPVTLLVQPVTDGVLPPVTKPRPPGKPTME